MKNVECTFYRPEEVNVSEFNEIMRKLEYDYSLICQDEASDETVHTYAEKLISLAKPLARNPEMYFLGLDEPDQMASDARVDFFYKPTYIGSGIVMKAVMKNPELLKEHERIIHGLLLGSTGRGFQGHGFDGFQGLLETLTIFGKADCKAFLAVYPRVCTEFTRLYRDSLKHLEAKLHEGPILGDWGEDYTEQVKEVLSLNKSKHNTERL